MSHRPRHKATVPAAPPGVTPTHGRVERLPDAAAEPGELVVDLREIHKSFGRAHVLDGVTLQIPRGVIAGFLGPNGSGKSTTLRVLLGLLRADAGTATVLGRDAWRDAVDLHGRLAYVPGDVTLWPGLTGGECIDVLGRLRGGLDAGRAAELTQRFQLDPRKKARAYSKGNRQKVALVAALAADVDLLVLDEPTSGLDPLMEREFQDVVRERRVAGTSVLLSSHILSEVEHLCDTVAIIRAGTVVEQGPLEALRHLTRATLHATTRRDPRETRAVLDVHQLSVEPTAEGFRVTGGVESRDLPSLLPALHGLGVLRLEVTPASLEDLFMRHYRSDPAPENPAETASSGTTGRMARREASRS